MKSASVLVATVLIMGAASLANANELQLSIRDGHVTLKAENVPVRQILAEWARVGQTRIVNAEKLIGLPVTLELNDIPERQALDILLRSAGGYMAAQREDLQAGLSRYDRILILATAAPVTAVGGGQRANIPGMRQNQPGVASPPGSINFPGPVADDPGRFMSEGTVDDDLPTPASQYPALAAPGQMTPGVVTPGLSPTFRPPETNFNYANPTQIPQLQQQLINGVPQVSPYPGLTSPTSGQTAPGVQGASRPGVVVPPPPQQPIIRNPYGIPTPPTQPPPQGQQPDRSKYANPNQPPPS